jgi:GNAT superfamily N-acetyltransferase
MVRPAVPEDIPTIWALIGELARFERLEHQVVGTADLLREHLFGADRRAEALLAEHEGEIVGFALFFHSYSTFLARPGLYLEDLFVLPAHRRKGFGRELLVAVARIAVERGCGRFEWSVLTWNEPAISFYRGLGAELLEEWRTFRVTGQALLDLAGEV